jgi:Spy/CpxP family protein refolding chaperone
MRDLQTMWRLPGIDSEILDELDLTKEQREKIESIITESRKGMQKELISVRAQMAQSGKEISEEITKILKPEQQQKYREILEKEKLNFPPPIFIFDVDELNLSEVQREKIENILEGRAQHLRVGYRDIRNHISGPMRELRTRIDSVLTPDQQKKLRELTSPKGWRREPFPDK